MDGGRQNDCTNFVCLGKQTKNRICILWTCRHNFFFFFAPVGRFCNIHIKFSYLIRADWVLILCVVTELWMLEYDIMGGNKKWARVNDCLLTPKFFSLTSMPATYHRHLYSNLRGNLNYAYQEKHLLLFLGQMVYSVRRRCGQQLAIEAPVEADLVSTVPESATPAALGYAQKVCVNLLSFLKYIYTYLFFFFVVVHFSTGY